MDRPFVSGEAGMLKMLRRRRAKVVFPDELGPDRPMMTVWLFSMPLVMAPPILSVSVILSRPNCSDVLSRKDQLADIN